MFANRFFVALLTAVVFVTTVFDTHSQAAPWPYDPLYQPLTRQEVVRLFRDPKVPFKTRRIALSRAGVNGLLEVVVAECSIQLRKRPRDPVLRGFYCYALFIAHDPADYKPQNKKEWLRQQNNLFSNAAIQADYLVKEKGSNISFCWQSLAYVNLMGMAGGIPKAIENAEKAVQLAPDDPFAYRILASAYLKSGSTQDLPKALANARRAIALQPKSQRPYSYQAQALFLQKKYVPAYNALKKSYALQPPKFRDPQFLNMYAAWARHEASQKPKS